MRFKTEFSRYSRSQVHETRTPRSMPIGTTNDTSSPLVVGSALPALKAATLVPPELNLRIRCTHVVRYSPGDESFPPEL